MKIVAKILLIDSTDNILVLRRNYTHPNFPNHYDFPGGEVEENENNIEAVQREITEETGLQVSLNSINLGTKKRVNDNLLHVVYLGRLNTHKPKVLLSWEHESYEWIPIDMLKNELLPKNVDNYYLTALDYLHKNKLA